MAVERLKMPKYDNQKAFLTKRLNRDINEFLNRQEIIDSVPRCVLKIVGIRGKVQKITWPKSSPPPNLSKEKAEMWLPEEDKMRIKRILGQRIFVLSHCVKQFRGGEPGIWEMIEAGGP